jgi:hypothetical protein
MILEAAESRLERWRDAWTVPSFQETREQDRACSLSTMDVNEPIPHHHHAQTLTCALEPGDSRGRCLQFKGGGRGKAFRGGHRVS